MGRSRYKIYSPQNPYFITITILHWIPIFTRVDTVEIVLNSLKYLQKSDNLKIFSYVILENHIHIISESDDLQKTFTKFKSFTAREIIKYLKDRGVKTILDQLSFYKKLHKKDREFQLWQEGISPRLIKDENMMVEKINYIHQNPVKRGFVDKPEHWRYSSSRDYNDVKGLIDICRVF